LFTDAASNIGSIMRNDFLINVTTNISTGDPSASINQLTLNTNFVASLGNATAGLMYIGAGLNKNTITDDGTAISTVTMVQNAGIFALTPLQSISEYTGLGSTTISHYAGLVINGIKSTTGSQITITNNYQLLINSSQQFSGSTTIANKWGIYQAGANDYNYFNANTILGSSTPIDSGDKLQVNGTGNFIRTTNGSASVFVTNTENTPLMAFNANGGLTCGTIGLTGGNIEQFNFINTRNNGFFNFFTNNTNVLQITPTALLIDTTTNANSVKLKVNGIIIFDDIYMGKQGHAFEHRKLLFSPRFQVF
jgi:hypothetical protein